MSTFIQNFYVIKTIKTLRKILMKKSDINTCLIPRLQKRNKENGKKNALGLNYLIYFFD